MSQIVKNVHRSVRLELILHTKDTGHLCLDAIFVLPILQTSLGGSKEVGGQRNSQNYMCKHSQ